jgi:hypothetical protein
MSLSTPVEREAIHTRQVICQGFHRADGLWDIEGRIIDTKTYDFPNRDRGGIKAGEPIHQMVVRVTIDDDFVIHAVEAETLHAPFHICGDVAPSFAALRGLKLGKGFRRQLQEKFGGVHGCTHIVELFGPIATTAFQTIFPLLQARRGNGGRPPFIDQCHAMAADGPIVADHWPEWATPRKDAAQ